MAPQAKSSASTKPEQAHFQKYGLDIPLSRYGKKCLHARSAQELETKSQIDLKSIVGRYYGKKSKRLALTLGTNLAIAEWIERVETLAFGPHPESKLPSTEKEALLAALGFKEAKQSKAKKDAPRRKPKPQKTIPPTKRGATPEPPTPSSLESRDSGEQEQKQDWGQALEQELEQALEVELEEEPADPTEVAPIKNTRKHARETSPADDHPTPPKRIRTTATSTNIPPNPPPSTTKENPTPPSQSPTPLHPSTQNPVPPGPPFLKPWTHGRHGDFTRDPDLLAGRGHQVEPSHWEGNLEYRAHHTAFYAKHPFFPYADASRRVPAMEEECEGLEELRDWERWMRAYRTLYSGEVVAHLWDCGCEKVRGEEESEEE
ncbi:hypothetical protein E8E13_011292 [Curvularia kusanoi]|uniref:Uncharacterized protein n=1 Tax=Curvularia kusanoi TaxID=90978 RepID=A0A9P4TN05_CURKU|nr:hypothetical protein E8E13_011292 [Curvularia kusanoi]